MSNVSAYFPYPFSILVKGILLHLKSFSVLLVPESAAAQVGSIETIILCFPILAILRRRPFAVLRKYDCHVVYKAYFFRVHWTPQSQFILNSFSFRWSSIKVSKWK